MTPERARQIIAATPPRGSYADRMTTEEKAWCWEQWSKYPSRDISFSEVVRRIAAAESFDPAVDAEMERLFGPPR